MQRLEDLKRFRRLRKKHHPGDWWSLVANIMFLGFWAMFAAVILGGTHWTFLFAAGVGLAASMIGLELSEGKTLDSVRRSEDQETADFYVDYLTGGYQ